MRNAIHHALSASYGRPGWYDLITLSQHWQAEVASAKRKVQQITPGPPPPPPGKVLAELSFGFWIDLLSRPHHNTLWVGKRMRTAFPNATLQRKDVHRRFKSIQRLRNRISHHERILTSRHKFHLGGGFLTLPEMIEPVEWICADTADWLKTRFRYSAATRVLGGAAGTGVHL